MLRESVVEEAFALEVEGVGKTYRLWASPASRLWVPLLYRMAALVPGLGGKLQQRLAARVHEHRALENICFTLPRGAALGIIGHNGSGKSTLLQIVAGVLQPSEGRVRVNGRVAALLELGSGFNPELTGRENVRVNAAILGLSPAQVNERMQAIIEFADIGEYIDEPVKTYSSGMALRLAFAVQVHTDPDILIVDEALAVGDAAFQAKAMARVDEILKRGTTLLFVGHDLNAVRAFCHRAMLLEKGSIVMEGLPDEVITEYLYRAHKKALAARDQTRGERVQRLQDGYGLEDSSVTDSHLNGGLQHVSLRHGDGLDFALDVQVGANTERPQLIFDLMDGRGLQLTGRRIDLPVGPCKVRVRIRMSANFQQGVYRIRTRIVDAPAIERTTILSRQEGRLSFEVVDDSRERFTGLFPVPMQIEVGSVE